MGLAECRLLLSQTFIGVKKVRMSEHIRKIVHGTRRSLGKVPMTKARTAKKHCWLLSSRKPESHIADTHWHLKCKYLQDTVLFTQGSVGFLDNQSEPSLTSIAHSAEAMQSALWSCMSLQRQANNMTMILSSLGAELEDMGQPCMLWSL